MSATGRNGYNRARYNHHPPMIRHLHVDNYKSIQGASIDLGAFNCLIGANNSGKSNLLDVLFFLSDISRYGLGQAIAIHGGDGLRHYGSSRDHPIKLEILLDGPQERPGTQVRYTLAFTTDPVEVWQETMLL